MRWTIIHTAVGGGNLGEHDPINLEFGIRLSSIGFVTHQLPAHHIYHGGSAHAQVEPYATDFILRRGNVDMMGGLVVEASSELGDEMVNFAGLDWRHYLERRNYPFDPANPTKYFYAAVQQDLFVITEQIITTTLAEPDSLQGLTMNNGTCGVLINYRIEPGDGENMYDKLNSLAEGDPGFDHEISADKQLTFYAPRKTGESAMILEEGKNVAKLGGANKGPRGSHVLGQGAGSSRRLASLKVNTDISRKYRRHDVIEDFGDITNAAHLDNLTQGYANDAAKTQRDLIVKVAPGHADEVWDEAPLGYLMQVRGSTGYEVVDDVFRLIAINGVVNNQGDEDLTLEFESAST